MDCYSAAVLPTRDGTAPTSLHPHAAAAGPPRTGGPHALISEPLLAGTVRLLDGMILSAAAIASCIAVSGVAEHHARLLAALIGAGVTMLCLNRGRSYALSTLHSPAQQVRLASGSLAFGVAAVAATIAFLRPADPFPASWLWSSGLYSAAGLGLSRGLVAWRLRVWRQAGCLTRRVAVVGCPERAGGFARRAAQLRSDMSIVGIYDDGFDPDGPAGARVDGQIADLVARCRRERIDGIVMALPLNQQIRIAEARLRLAETVADVYLATDFGDFCSGGARLVRLASEHALLVHERPIKDWDALQKRIFDAMVAAILAAVLAPALACIALAIKLDSPGPVLFRQPRVGFNNVELQIFKFRTMFEHCTDLLADRQTTRGDRRVTRVGRWLRALSLDELPQLYNVLRGDMSLVGPRPHAPNTKAEGRLFPDVVAEYALRHRVKPGITGWAQVNGWRGETRTALQIEKRVACDLYYIDNWSLLLDVKILWLTLLRGISGPQAY